MKIQIEFYSHGQRRQNSVSAQKASISLSEKDLKY